MTLEQRQKLSERMKLNNPNKGGIVFRGKPNLEASKRMKEKNPRHFSKDVWSKEVYQYDINGKFLKKWNSYTEAMKYCGIKASKLSSYFKNDGRTCGGYVWKKNYEGENIYVRNIKKKDKIVSLYNYEGCLFKTFSSLKECANYLNVKSGCVSTALKKKMKLKGYNILLGNSVKIEIKIKEKSKKRYYINNEYNITSNYINDDGKYYVYRHIRLDKNTPFYIGIGTKRKYQYSFSCHSEYYHRSYNKRKRNKIWNDIVNKNNGKFEVQIILESDNYNFIKAKEQEFIKLYGRIDLGTGTLANLTNGGDGSLGVNVDKYKTAKTVYVYDFNTGDYICKYLSTQDAGKSLGLNRGSISSVATNKIKKYKGYYFSYLYKGNNIKI